MTDTKMTAQQVVDVLKAKAQEYGTKATTANGAEETIEYLSAALAYEIAAKLVRENLA